MDWILSHLGFVVPVVVFFVGWLSQLRQKRTEAPRREQSARGPVETVRPLQTPNLPVDDQVRRIQEEIRRKIQERAVGRASGRVTPPAIPAATLRPVPSRAAPTESPKRVVPPAKPIQLVRSLDSKTTEELRQIEDRRRETRKAEQAVVQTANASQAAGTDGTNLWTTELRNPAALRRAFILREVLGPPVSMRR